MAGTLTRGRTASQAVEEHPNTYLMLRFNSEMRDRGWADFNRGIVPLPTALAHLERLRSVILEMFSFASAHADANPFDELRAPMQETLIAGLDTVLIADGMTCARPRSFEKHRKLVEQLDELSELHSTSPLYSEHLAQSLRVSTRTLQTAVQVVHGMSLHRYLTSKRLWSVRRQLTAGNLMATVKAVALASGFWHMGEFSRVYKTHFGELPSETLFRARHYN
jgi:AraC-like DNA-binding protein